MLKLGALALLLSTINYGLSTSHAQGTAFTYQGRLNDANGPASGVYDFKFALHSAAAGASQVGVTAGISGVAVSNGLFTVLLDFGNQFSGADRWLEIAVQTNGFNTFTTLAPRQQLTPTPYAITAGNLSGTLPLAQLPAAVVTNGAVGVLLNGTFTGNGAGVTNVNAEKLGGYFAGNYWQLGGNNVSAGQFLGSTNFQAVDFKVNGVRALRLEPGIFFSIPNVIGGAAINYVAFGDVGSVIAGGGAENLFGVNYTNGITANFAFIGGGGNNLIYNADYSVLGGGQGNSIQGNDHHAFLGAGQGNTIGNNSWNSVLGGGENNSIQDSYDAVLGGGSQNSIGPTAFRASIVGGQFNQIQYSAYGSTIGGGEYNNIGTNDSYGVIVGGYNNRTFPNSSYTFMGGGLGNNISSNAPYSTISGGNGNLISERAVGATIGGGIDNSFSTYNGFLSYSALYGTIGGGIHNTCLGPVVTIGGGTNNYAAFGSTVGGGANNYAYVSSTVGGGDNNGAGGDYSLIGGGESNKVAVYASHSSIGGGFQNTVGTNAQYAAIGGGSFNLVGGSYNYAGEGNYSVVAGGSGNQAAGNYAAVPGGDRNVALNHAFAAGHRAIAGDGAFVWADARDFDFFIAQTNSVNFRCTGGAQFVTSIDGFGNSGAGVYLAPGGASWASLSDQNAKKNFTAVTGTEVLDKLAAVPVEKWNYKWEKDSDVPNIGPMAQAFKSAFYPGRDDKSITTLEFDGVELAAIQGLNQKVEAGSQKSEVRILKIEAENAELKVQLNELKVLVKQLAAQK